MIVPRPTLRPHCPNFSSGPCAKRPGYRLAGLDAAMLGRSHRGAAPRARIAEVIERSRALLGIPPDWRLGVVPGSDTGAVEMAMWSLLGPRPVDILAFDSFSQSWATDVLAQLRLPGARVLGAPYGALPDLAGVDPDHDLVFAWNGTTSGVRVADACWIAPGRAGLAICDATSAAFAMRLDWSRLDVVTWSWQKALGGEAGHGMLALSPRAAERLASHRPVWPLPKIFRLTDAGGALLEGIFAGDTINTVSLLCVEDALDGLRWAERIGGLPALIGRAEANLATIAAWLESPSRRDSEGAGIGFLARTQQTRSPTSICLTVDPPHRAAGIAALLDREGVGHDIASYRDAPPGLRIWGGATVERADIAALLPWIDWAACELA